MKFTIAVIALLAISASAQNAWSTWQANINANVTTGCGTNAGTCATAGGQAITTSCTGAFYFGSQGGTCTALGTGCLLGSSSTVCTVCSQGYFLSAGACTACPASCTACTSAASCQACVATGLYTLATGACTSTTLYFQALKAGVKAGTALSAGTTCSLADANNLGICIQATITGTTGYDYIQATGGAITPGTALANCLAYSTAGSLCYQCQNGYVPSTITTTSITLCTASASTVTNWVSGCTLYGQSTGGTAAVSCGACAAGWYPNTAGSACYPCVGIASNCNMVPTSAGYAWSVPTSAWISCTAQSSNAASCWISSGGTYYTTVCATGYYLSAAGTCAAGSALATGCAVGSAMGCVLCQPGYFLASASNCSACPGNCTGCANLTSCIGCLNSIVLTNGTCPNKGSALFSGLAFISAILYYFI